jgi:hypothetical protein
MARELIRKCGVVFALLAIGCSQPDAGGQGGDPQPAAQTPAPPKPPGSRLPECGDKAVMERFKACKEAASKFDGAACEAAGGNWGNQGLHQGCNCPTGQGGCPCAASSDCLGECLLTPGSRSCPKSVAEGSWRCSAHHDVVGCNCRLVAEDMMMAMCAD